MLSPAVALVLVSEKLVAIEVPVIVAVTEYDPAVALAVKFADASPELLVVVA